MGQGQPRVIILTTLVGLPYTMLHTKFQGHRYIGSGEEDFLRFLPYMSMAAMLVMWPRSFEQLFFPKGPGGCIWNLVAIGPVVSEEKSFEIVDGRRTTYVGRTDGRRTTEPAYTISSPGAFGSGELKKIADCDRNYLIGQKIIYSYVTITCTNKKITCTFSHDTRGQNRYYHSPIFHCIFIEKPRSFSKLVQLIMKV